MREILDPLIAERAPWLHAGRGWRVPARVVLELLLGYPRTLRVAAEIRDLPPAEIFDRMAALLARDVRVNGLARVPRSGPALIVANHPTGIADGIILWSVLRALRPDLYFFANADILRVLPQMGAMVAPVEWRPEKRSRAKARVTLGWAQDAIAAGRLGVIFPSGRLAKREGLALHERPWLASAATLARRHALPVVPVNIRARNSTLFYLFDAIHPTLRDITLFHETLNKARQSFVVSVGNPVAPGTLPEDDVAATEALREMTLALSGRAAPALSLIENTAALRRIAPRRVAP